MVPLAGIRKPYETATHKRVSCTYFSWICVFYFFGVCVCCMWISNIIPCSSQIQQNPQTFSHAWLLNKHALPKVSTRGEIDGNCLPTELDIKLVSNTMEKWDRLYPKLEILENVGGVKHVLIPLKKWDDPDGQKLSVETKQKLIFPVICCLLKSWKLYWGTLR